MISTTPTQNKFALLALVLIFAIMAFFYYHTPWYCDDYCYGCQQYSSFGEILHSEYKHYFTTNGRSVAHLYARFLLRADNIFYIIIHASIFTSLMILPLILCWGKKWKQYFCAKNILFFFSLVWLTAPFFGQVFLWRIGSSNYMLTLFIAMLFLLPYRMIIEQEDFNINKGLQVLFLIGALLAGWTNENLGALVTLLAFCAVCYGKSQKKNIPYWAYTGIVLAFTGWLFLILAPGNYIRLTQSALPLFKQPIFEPIRFFIFTQIFLCIEYFLCFIFIILLIKKKVPVFKNIWVIIYTSSIIGISAFFFSAEPPPRAFTSTSYLMMVATLALFGLFSIYYKRISHCITAILIGLAALSIGDSAIIFIESKKVADERVILFENSENKDVVVTNFKYRNKYFFPGDAIGHDPTAWTNTPIQKKYNLKSVVAAPDFFEIKTESILWPVPYWTRIVKEILQFFF